MSVAVASLEDVTHSEVHIPMLYQVLHFFCALWQDVVVTCPSVAHI